MIYDSILEVVGKTPVLRLNRIGADSGVELFVKCEYLNPGGSVKDRIAVRMVEELEKEGRINAESTLIEPTSGNTGTGLAMTCAVKNLPLCITMPEKMSQEKQVVMEALGARIYRTPTEAAHDDPESLLGVAKRLNEEIENSIIPDQYENMNNPLAHYYGTGAEIWEEFGDSLDLVVIGAGTGGTIAGVAKYLKEKNPKIRIIGIDPEGSVLGGRKEVDVYHVEGIGYDFVPGVLEYENIDGWIYSNDRDSFHMARRLIREEGLLVGGSSGAAVWGLLEAIKQETGAKRALTILPDSIRNYLTKFVSDQWMRENGFLEDDHEV
ncbi:MAG: pyridoxal-phosphate dependent enzyme [Candidatus Krumholzibacteria bacterium]|jgi:cystathionine beta-synthase/cysteine synthase A|nr:pyridoxal-phosphate dependent enzyme [Candidatus Krumholzibacteria bacterium]MDP7022139.1 pyridoxal-phosphate dependent enzyme [Candidatus Krumholzibacteria bacterium]